MSLVDHLGRITHRSVVHCAECGDPIPRRDAFVVDGESFCCVLHEVEHAVRSI
ncbi:formylmethanofuran dehydrogenase subunit E [Curtobacterium sp. PvP017]|uniref:hypothetical protein n=1 Tax=Curtobacterium sp. KT1 TaxID=3372858 RepID=UPI0037BEB1C8